LKKELNQAQATIKTKDDELTEFKKLAKENIVRYFNYDLHYHSHFALKNSILFFKKDKLKSIKKVYFQRKNELEKSVVL